MTTPARILVVEDDPSILLGLRLNLEDEGYQVGTAEDGESGLAEARSMAWDLIILDLMLPGLNGYEVVSTLRAERNPIPVLILSAKSAEGDMVMGLDLGADDYITKPFAVGELLARVRAALRRRSGDPRHRWTFGEIEVNGDTREVSRGGEPVDLTATELDVLIVLLKAGGRALTRAQIMEAVWGPDHFGTRRTIDNFVAQLRTKLGDDAVQPRHLITVRGVGYRLAQ